MSIHDKRRLVAWKPLVVLGIAGALVAAGVDLTGRQDDPVPSIRPVAIAQRAIKVYTNCGVDRAVVGDQVYVPVTPLYKEGGGNPPDGWTTRSKPGIMTFYRDGVAIFTDDVGHRLEFIKKPRNGADLQACF